VPSSSAPADGRQVRRLRPPVEMRIIPKQLVPKGNGALLFFRGCRFTLSSAHRNLNIVVPLWNVHCKQKRRILTAQTSRIGFWSRRERESITALDSVDAIRSNCGKSSSRLLAKAVPKGRSLSTGSVVVSSRITIECDASATKKQDKNSVNNKSASGSIHRSKDRHNCCHALRQFWARDHCVRFTPTSKTWVGPNILERNTIHWPSGVKVTFGSSL